MYCTNCGRHNSDNAAFCVNCGSSLAGQSVPAQQVPLTPPVIPTPQVPVSSQVIHTQPAHYTPVQGSQASVSQGVPVIPIQAATQGAGQKPLKKSRKGLVIGLIIGGIVLIAAIVLFVVLAGFWLTGKSSDDSKIDDRASIAGLWSSEERAEVLKFKDNGTVYIYSAEDDRKGEYEYDSEDSEGIITVDDSDYGFVIEDDEIDVDNMGIYVREDAEDFDVDEFIENADSAAGGAADTTPSQTTAAPTPEPTAPATVTTAAVGTVVDMEIVLSFDFGDFSGLYTGDFVNDLPNGYGSFMSSDSDGVAWVYDGQWVDGHFNGQGTTTWEDGYSETGMYRDDYLNGEGKEYLYGSLRYEGTYTDAYHNGQGTLYNHHGEVIFSGSFNYGFIQETPDARNARVGAFKDQSVPVTGNDLYQACETETSVHAAITGTVFDIFVYDVDDQYYCDFLMYEQGIEDSAHIVLVYYRLTEGEPMVTDGQSVTVWGTTEYLYSYTSNSDEYLTVPLLEAWSVE